MSTTTATAADPAAIAGPTLHRNLSTAALVEAAIRRGEGELAANGAIVCDTGARRGRSPSDKFLEDTPAIHDSINWGKVNQPISPSNFEAVEQEARRWLASQQEVFRFDGYAGADPTYRLRVSVVAAEAWHALFAKTLFINVPPSEQAGFRSDWTILAAGGLELEDPKRFGLNGPIGILQSLERRTVVIVGTRYAGEIKKSIFYAMNYDLPAKGVFPMHCSANVAHDDPSNVALFFGLSGTGKTTLSADPGRELIGDDEHGWSDQGVFNVEGGCYAKCIRLSEAGEPQIWNAIRFGSVLENVVMDPQTRVPDYDSDAKTENTRVTYPVDFIENARIPSVGGHPKHVIFLTADAFGVLPPLSRLTPEQAMYYFVNGYTSKLAGTEAGVTEPQPNFSPCFGGPFLPRSPLVYAEMLAKKIRRHDAKVWLLNTGWTGGPYGVGERFKLSWTRTFVSRILDGSLDGVACREHPIFGLHMPSAVRDVPSDVLDPINTWKDKAAYEAKARDLARRFRENDAKYELTDEVRRGGPRG